MKKRTRKITNHLREYLRLENNVAEDGTVGGKGPLEKGSSVR